MNTIITKQDDTWDKLALRELGSELLMDKLIAVNLSYARTVIFNAGIVVNVPEVDYQVYADINLPPWRK